MSKVLSVLLKVSRWVALAAGAVLLVIGGNTGNETITGIGIGLTGWAVPFVKDIIDVKSWAKGARQFLDLLTHEDSPPEVKKLANTASAAKVAELAAKSKKKA